MRKPIDIAGQVFGRLTVLHRSGSFPDGQAGWTCSCECGTEVQVCGGDLRSGGTKSCGCLRVDNMRKVSTKHGLCTYSGYKSWSGMLDRCLNPKHGSYKDYGGRGITVCDRWLDVKNFIADMGERPPGLSLERLDGNRGYSKENCIWADRKTQARNKRSNRLLTFNGKTATLAEHCEDAGLKYDTVSRRLNGLGWSLEKALTTPIRLPIEYTITSKP